MGTVGETPTRRRFLEAGIAGGCLLLCPRLARSAGEAEAPGIAPPRIPVFDARLSYCCAECTPEKCDWLSANIEVKKRKAAELKQKLGREIAPDEIGCSRCRVDERSALDSIRGCPIRKCVLEKKLASCAHCAELPGCKRANPITRDRALAIRQQLLAQAEEEAR